MSAYLSVRQVALDRPSDSKRVLSGWIEAVPMKDREYAPYEVLWRDINPSSQWTASTVGLSGWEGER